MRVDGWRVYVVRCADGTLYTGISVDVEARVQKHNKGKGARYTAKRRPVKLVAQSRSMEHGEALRAEYQIKQAPRNMKVFRCKSC
jgi:putative endonuclease